MKFKNYLATVTISTLIALSAFASMQNAHRREQATIRPNGRFTQQQILDLSRPLLCALAPNASSMNTTLLPLEMPDGKGGVVHLWLVDAVDPVGAGIAHLVWQADSGELITASRTSSLYRHSKRTQRDKKDLIRISGEWLTTLGISTEASGWRVTEADRNGHLWHISWSAPGHRMLVSLDVTSGELVMAQSTWGASDESRLHPAIAKRPGHTARGTI